MNLDWILSPLTLYTVVALALVGCASLFVVTKMELGQLRRAADQSRLDLAKKIEEVELAVADIPVAAPAPMPMLTLRPSINLTKRAQALRMRRRGETLESITAALAVPRNEIELLLKVHEMVDGRNN
jgi:hypothetical protein